MITLHKTRMAAALLALLFIAGTSCRKAEPYEIQVTKVASLPNTVKPQLPPVIPSSDLQVLNKFNPLGGESDVKIRSTDEVFGTASDRSFAYNEFNNNSIVYYMYGGNTDEQLAGRWFSRIILQWDAGSHSWKVFYNDGVQYFSRISDEITLAPDAWYYTLQWVWDDAGSKWIKFDANLLVHA